MGRTCLAGKSVVSFRATIGFAASGSAKIAAREKRFAESFQIDRVFRSLRQKFFDFVFSEIVVHCRIFGPSRGANVGPKDAVDARALSAAFDRRADFS